MSKSRVTKPLNNYLILRVLLFVLGLAGVSLHAQSIPELMPQRGVTPNGLYSFDNIEAINKVTGTVSLSIPITSLPKGRAGVSFPINLNYNSAIWDAITTSDSSYQNPTVITSYHKLTKSDLGGWRYGYYYGVDVEQIQAEGCGNVEQFNDLAYYYKLRFTMPDGAAHDLFLYDQQESIAYGFYVWSPVTGASSCSGTLAGPLTYYTADGSYIKLVMNPQANQNNTWTAYLPDGTVVAGGAGQTETIQDRNGNTVTLQNYLDPDTQNPISTIQDDLGRTVTITHGDQGYGSMNTDTITQTAPYGVNKNTWTVTWEQISVGGNSDPYLCSDGADLCPAYVTAQVISSITLPTVNSVTLSYTFGYNDSSVGGWGELGTVQLPSGGRTTYTFVEQGQTNPSTQAIVQDPLSSKTVFWTDTSDGVSTLRPETTRFGVGLNSTTIINPDKGQETIYYTQPYSSPYLASLFNFNPFSNLVYMDIRPDGSTIETLWQLNTPFNSLATDPQNPYVAASIKTVASGGQPSLAAVTAYTYDKNGNQLSSATYDWTDYSAIQHNNGSAVSGYTPGVLLKTIKNTYNVSTGAADAAATDDSNAYWNPLSQPLRSLLMRAVTSGKSAPVAAVEYSYGTNGNVKEKREWDSTKSAALPGTLDSGSSNVSEFTYDTYGNVLTTKDARLSQTTYSYDGNSLYLTGIVRNSNGLGGTRSLSTNASFDFSSGLLLSKTDADNSIATAYAYDPWSRLLSVTEAGLRVTTTSYDDVNRRVVVVESDPTGLSDEMLVNVTDYDQLGRVSLTRQLENPATQSSTDDTAGIKVQTRYLYSGGNYRLVSNPYRAPFSSSAGNESTMGWTLTTYDQNGRQIASSSFDGSAPPFPWGNNGSSSATVATSYSAQNTTVIDQNNAQRTSAVDALGRLSSVIEYPQSGNDVKNPNTSTTYTTNYAYDALDNLTGVNQLGTDVKQPGQTRTFVYDSLKRLIASTNPENYTPQAPAALGCAGGVYATCYSYDSNGNLTSKTDNRGMQIAYQYDGLNRLTGKSYNSQAAVSYTYDSSGNNSIGLLSSVSTLLGDTSTTTYTGYDALGRVTGSSQKTAGNTYTFSYSFNLAGSLNSETYPSGRVVNTCYDGANRVNQVGGGSCTSSTGAYAYNFQYAPHGAPTQYVYGNGLWNEPSYNSRLQMSGFVYLTNNNNQTVQLLQATLDWGKGNNNGNLRNATYSNSGPSYATPLVFNQNFLYDGVNRLLSATDNGGWSRSFAYDAVGNMTASGNPAVTSLSFNSNNQINGETYDQTGNQQTAGGNKLAYDFENRIVSETDGVSHAVETYVYDGDGRRVEKYGPSETTKTVFVYDALGRMAAEYSTAADSSPCTTCYLSYDHLGTPRLITDSNALVKARHDYLPFGEELGSGVAGRNTDWGPGKDEINQKFTGKERDSESGLDYFGARYYGSALGRFTSPDEFKGGFDDLDGQAAFAAGPIPYADISDPQTLNKYVYVRNNPLRYVDPNGHCFWDACIGEGYATAVAVGALATATAAYLASPSGQQAIQATGQLIQTGLTGIQNLVTQATNSNSNQQNAPPPTQGAQTATDQAAPAASTPQPKANPMQGTPGSTSTTTHADGTPKQTREYGSDGYPKTDVDRGHDHGQGDPHAHDWGRPADGGPPTHVDRAPGRPLKPGDPQP